MTFRWACYIW